MQIVNAIMTPADNRIFIQYRYSFNMATVTAFLLHNWSYAGRKFKVDSHTPFYKSREGIGYINFSYFNSSADQDQ